MPVVALRPSARERRKERKDGKGKKEGEAEESPDYFTRRNQRSLREPRHHGKEKAPLLGLDFEMVDRRGLEPRTLGLRVPCSTN